MSLPSVSGAPAYDAVFWAGMVFAALVAASGLAVETPYGRFGTRGWGPAMPPRLGWFVMELPATLSFLWFDLRGPLALRPAPLVLLGVWLVHYGNRGFLFPARMRVRRGAGMSLVVVLLGMGVTAVHGYLNGAWIGGLGRLGSGWFGDPRFGAGLALWALGFGLNVHSDAVLRRLRATREVAGDGGYAIPRGGAFRWVSCPNYLGELLAWAGFALAAWSPGGLFIECVTAANLVPRALATHKWYRERFADYPRARRALIPFVL